MLVTYNQTPTGRELSEIYHNQEEYQKDNRLYCTEEKDYQAKKADGNHIEANLTNELPSRSFLYRKHEYNLPPKETTITAEEAKRILTDNDYTEEQAATILTIANQPGDRIVVDQPWAGHHHIIAQ